MRLGDLMRVSLRQVLRHRRRYLGVALAIALGTAGFITIITMGRDFKRNCNRDLDLIGSVTVIRVSLDNQRASRPQSFQPRTLAALRHLPEVRDLSAVAVGWSAALWQKLSHSVMVLAVDESFWEVRGFWPQTGRLFGLSEVLGRQRQCVLGAELARKFFGHLQVAGLFLEIDQELFQVSGVLGGVIDSTLANAIFLPLTTAQDRLPGPTLTDRLYLRCQTWDDVAKVAAVVPGVVQRHQPASGLRVEVSWEALKRVQQVAWWIEFFIYVAVSATLLLGGVGILNVMLAAVRSRTREIGLKKAMGAEDKDILSQFLAEALCLSLGAALVGVALGRAVVELLSLALGSPVPEDLFFLCLVLGLLFATGLGVAAGLYPSLKASRMEVLTATRYE